VVVRQPLTLGAQTALTNRGQDLGLTIEPFAVPGKIALYLEDAKKGPGFGTAEGDTIGLEVTDASTGQSFFYLPACAQMDATLADRISGAKLVFFDGTLFKDDEMVAQGLSDKTGRRMGHMSISGADGSIAAFRDLDVQRRVFIHLNTSNPVLDEASPERAAVTRAGWDVAFDGMEVQL
jgi:pyrroloquinoline quinone biosynthesis protein B